MAEAVFRHLVQEAKLEDQIEVDSAGTSDWHIGKVPHKGTRAVLDQHTISYQGMVARQFQKEDETEFDYMIVMDDSNKEDVLSICPLLGKEKLFLLTDFIQDREDTFVPDPYFTGDFDYTYELVTEGCRRLLAQIQEQRLFV